MPKPSSRNEPRSAPVILLPYQQRWVNDSSAVKVCEKSRRIGMSWCTAAEQVLEAAKSDGDDCWYVGYNKTMAEEYIRDCAFWARKFNLQFEKSDQHIFKDEDKDILTFALRFQSGKRITALSSRPNNLRAKQGYVVVDEAAFHENLDELLKAALALIMWGGRVAVLSTHDGTENPFYELCRKAQRKDNDYSHHRITLDDALAEGLYKRICLGSGRRWTAEKQKAWRKDLLEFYGEGAQEELFCIARTPDSSGLVYRFDDRLNIIERAPVDPSWQFVLSIDLGASTREATTAFCLLAFSYRHPNSVYALESHAEAAMIPSTIAERIQQFDVSRLFRIICDPGALGKGYVEEFRRRHGLPVEAARKQDKAAFRRLLNGDLQRGTVQVVGPTNRQLIHELKTLPLDEKGLDSAPGVADHCSDAFLYGWRECRHWLAQEPEEVPEIGTDAHADWQADKMKQKAANAAVQKFRQQQQRQLRRRSTKLPTLAERRLGY